MTAPATARSRMRNSLELVSSNLEVPNDKESDLEAIFNWIQHTVDAVGRPSLYLNETAVCAALRARHIDYSHVKGWIKHSTKEARLESYGLSVRLQLHMKACRKAWKRAHKARQAIRVPLPDL